MYHSGTRQEKDSLNLFRKLPSKNKNINAIDEIAKAYYYLFYYRRGSITLQKLNHALKTAKDISNPCLIKLALLMQLELYARENSLNESSFSYYAKLFNKLSSSEIDKAWIVFYKTLYESYTSRKPNNYDEYIQESISFFNTHQKEMSIGLQSHFLENIGTYFRTEQPILAEEYLQKNLSFPNVPYLQTNKFNANMDMAALSMSQKDSVKGKYYFNEAKKTVVMKDSLFLLSIYHRFRAYYYDLDSQINNYKEATFNLTKTDRLRRRLESQQNNLKISETEVQLRTAETEEKRLKNLYLSITLGSILLLGSTIGILVYRNTKRKQRIAEQEKELEIQKKEKLLKDQELNAIDAMIKGQEKERQRLASDLHDSVGATLSAAKLQFEHLSKHKDNLNNMDELFAKTQILLEEAYTEVRSMAHLKNSGVIAKKGLLPAVEKLAKNASNSNGLTIEVQDFGLDEKLEASLEVTIFRVIQELVTNIIKHAQATEANISITQHEDGLSIIVEDNGKGFNARKPTQNESMGLSSIEKRIEHLEGAMEVDSTLGKGTHVLIDIPI